MLELAWLLRTENSPPKLQALLPTRRNVFQAAECTLSTHPATGIRHWAARNRSFVIPHRHQKVELVHSHTKRFTMSSIGPQLPSQLTKRKRTPESDQPSSPAKHPRPAQNTAEIDLGESSDDDDDDYGPQAPTAGPTAPPQSASVSNNDEINLESDSDSDSGPAPPPQAQAASPSASSDESDDDYGPALPSASNRRGPIGPALPPTVSDAPTRDDWMLAPPKATGYSERDTTKMRARKFASKPSASAGSGGEISSIWTESPEEKLRRLQDSVLGRSSGQDGSSGTAGGSVKTKEEEQRNKRIAASIESQRGQSLYEEHQQQKRESRQGKPGADDDEEDDDPSKRGFDREKDMAIGGKLGSSQRKELVNKSANFGGRFQKGSFL